MGNKTGAARLGFALLLRFFELEGRYPESREKFPRAAVDYVAGLVRVDPSALAKYAWSGRTIEYHRAQIRGATGALGKERSLRLFVEMVEPFRPILLGSTSCRNARSIASLKYVDAPMVDRVNSGWVTRHLDFSGDRYGPNGRVWLDAGWES